MTAVVDRYQNCLDRPGVWAAAGAAPAVGHPALSRSPISTMAAGVTTTAASAANATVATPA
jgi:hypothetical protein